MKNKKTEYRFLMAGAGTLWTYHSRVTTPVVLLKPGIPQHDFPDRDTILFKLNIQLKPNVGNEDVFLERKWGVLYEKFLYSTAKRVKFGWISQEVCERILIPFCGHVE